MSTTIDSVSELRRTRRQLRWWRWGTFIAIGGIVAWSLVSLNGSVRGLAEVGERQELFVQHLSRGLEQEIVPDLENAASTTLTQIRPEVEQALYKLNDRVPELTQATLREVEALQTSLPVRGEKALDETFTKVLAEREVTIKKMFPEVTEEQVKKLMVNLADAAHVQLLAANEELFATHQKVVMKIIDHMNVIKANEKIDPETDHATWEMGIAMLDIVRDDLKDLEKAPTVYTADEVKLQVRNAAIARPISMPKPVKVNVTGKPAKGAKPVVNKLTSKNAKTTREVK